MKYSVADIDQIVHDISNTGFDKYGSYSSGCGYFGAKLAECIFFLPKTKQQVILSEMKQYLEELRNKRV